MAGNFLLEYIEKDSAVHRMNGAAKLISFLLWTTAIMLTYDTRFLIFLTFFGLFLFKVNSILFNFCIFTFEFNDDFFVFSFGRDENLWDTA